MAEPHALLNAASEPDARALLTRCCGATRWVEELLARRPFASRQQLFRDADEVWSRMVEPDLLEAFSHHPRIGEDLQTLRARFRDVAAWSGQEQAGVSDASDATLEALRDANRAYFDEHGFVFLICATGKSAQEMLSALRERLPHTRARELELAAREQAKIMRLRLEKLAP